MRGIRRILSGVEDVGHGNMVTRGDGGDLMLDIATRRQPKESLDWKLWLQNQRSTLHPCDKDERLLLRG